MPCIVVESWIAARQPATVPSPIAAAEPPCPPSRSAPTACSGSSGWSRKGPLPSLAREARVGALQCVQDRHPVEHGQVAHGMARVPGRGEGHVASADVTDHGDAGRGQASLGSSSPDASAGPSTALLRGNLEPSF
jgi:hypothetical protein